MPPGDKPPPPFRAERYELSLRGGGLATLQPIDAAAAANLAGALAAIDPWARLGIGSASLLAGLTRDDPHLCRRAIVVGSANAGVVVVRNPWLFGPYLNLLAVLPAYQRHGIGAAVLRWMEQEVRGQAGNLWLCASAFNSAALAFYERHGFDRIGDLPDLIVPGLSEVLMRKRLDAM
jgi:ribosomal protein S18 acetylase RimI-like enzyme